MIIDPPESLTPGAYLSLARKLQEDPDGRRPLKVALLSGTSFSFLEPYLVVECARRGLAASLQSGPFGQIEQALLDESAGAIADDTDVIVMALRVEDMFGDVYLRSDSAALQTAVGDTLERLEQCVELARSRSSARILVANFSLPAQAAADPFAANAADGPTHVLAAANAELARRMTGRADVFVWDYDGLVRSRGVGQWTDPRLWFLARQLVSGANLPFAAAHLARTIASTVFEPVKCLVLDLDNTLWGGAAGDDGIEGIEIGDDYPGSVFKQFQHAVAGLRERGVLLALASKNDEAPVREIFDKHPELILRWEHFASHRINWDAKSDNLRAIAAELNIGPDALALFDDNPVEREEVRQNAADVQVIEVPGSPLEYVAALLDSGLFDAPQRSAEDAERAGYYQAEARRSAAQATAASMEDFLASLEMRATLGAAGPETITRIAQLVGKTNQFNLTTRRHTQVELQRMADAEDWHVRWIRLADRYGDSGLIGVCIVHIDDSVATIDSLLMSCRVMNRSVERAILRDAIEVAISFNCKTLHGEFIATDRNAIVRDFFTRNGFSALADSGNFELHLGEQAELPAWPGVILREQ